MSHIILPYCAENVCIQVDSEGTLLYAVGSRSHVTLLDPRESHDRIAWNLAIPDTNCGVRSLAFNQQLLSVGTGAGHLFFYDMRARDWLMDKSGQRPCTFTASGGWLVSVLPLVQSCDDDTAPITCSNVITHSKMVFLHLLVPSTPTTTVHSEQRSSLLVDPSLAVFVGIMRQCGYDKSIVNSINYTTFFTSTAVIMLKLRN